jgi:hypothetical protein
MAKTQEATAAARNRGTATAVETDLSAKVKNAMDAIKQPFMSFAKGLSAINQKRGELAPRFMKAFGFWQAETGGTFVQFVRAIDPSIGEKRDEYRNHPTYQAADYLRRLQGAAGRTQTNDGQEQVQQTSPTDALARFMATLLNMIPEGRHAVIKTAMEQELHWDTRRIENLFKTATNVVPIFEVRGRTLDNLTVRLPEHHEQEALAS